MVRSYNFFNHPLFPHDASHHQQGIQPTIISTFFTLHTFHVCKDPGILTQAGDSDIRVAGSNDKMKTRNDWLGCFDGLQYRRVMMDADKN